MTEQAPGLLGSTIFIPEKSRYLHNQRLGLLQIKNPKVKKEFLYHVFNSRIIRKPISETSA
ncbi:Type I restriction-modification system, specificity subunit S, partial [hydrothermal vent metagenome]